MSDQDSSFQRWELPSFEPVAEVLPQVDLAEEATLARDRGLAQGLAEGRQQGLAEAKPIVDRLVMLLDEIARPYQSLDQEVTQELVRTAMRIARHIVRRELTLDSSVVAAAVTEAMATLSCLEGEVEIHLNPADSSVIRELAPELVEASSWKLIENDELLPGGCRLKTPVSYVDASVERQMEAMLAGLIQACEDTLETRVLSG